MFEKIRPDIEKYRGVFIYNFYVMLEEHPVTLVINYFEVTGSPAGMTMNLQYYFVHVLLVYWINLYALAAIKNYHTPQIR